MLLPLLKTEINSTSIQIKSISIQFNSNVTLMQIQRILQTILAKFNQEKSDNLLTVYKELSLPFSPTSKSNDNFCPTLKTYCVPFHDQWLHATLLRDLMSLNKRNETGYQKHMLSYDSVTRVFF